jgi:hypothetical protein
LATRGKGNDRFGIHDERELARRAVGHQIRILGCLLAWAAADALHNGLDLFWRNARTFATGSFQEMVDGLVPVLQKRGLHKYTGKTLREHLWEY